MIVVDASVILDLLLATSAAKTIDQRLFASVESLHAPQVLDLEVLQVLRRYNLAGQLPDWRASEAIEDFLAIPIERYPHGILVDRLWELRNNMTAYDAAYVALAELLGATLLTRDKKLASAASSAGVPRVECI